MAPINQCSCRLRLSSPCAAVIWISLALALGLITMPQYYQARQTFQALSSNASRRSAAAIDGSPHNLVLKKNNFHNFSSITSQSEYQHTIRDYTALDIHKNTLKLSIDSDRKACYQFALSMVLLFCACLTFAIGACLWDRIRQRNG